MSQGRFAEAWPEFAWRTRAANYPQRTWTAPLWQGEDLHGRTVLVHAEQGLGDTLMLMRYLPLAKARGGRVLLEVQPRLAPLLKSSGYADVVARDSQLPPFDFQIPILNLPAVFGTLVETIPREVPYLTADRKLVDAWREKLTPLAGFKVGIGWQGSRSYAQDRTRSILLAHFAPLAAVAGVRLISLQKADGREQLDDVTTKFTVHDLGPQLDEAGAFVDTAAVIENLDLVITSDTALAHLAARWRRPPGWRWPKCPSGAGSWTVRTALGTRRCVCFGSTRRVIGLKCLPALLTNCGGASHPPPRRERTNRDRSTTAKSPDHALGCRKLAVGDASSSVGQFRPGRRVLSPGAGQRAGPCRRASLVGSDRAGAKPARPRDPAHRYGDQVQPRAAQFHFHLATALRQTGKRPEAVASFRQAAKLDPNSATMQNELGSALHELGQVAEAEACYREASRLDPSLAAAHNNLGNALQDQQRWDEALAAFQAAQRLMPEAAEIYYNLGNCFRAQNKIGEAVAAYEQAIQRNPEFAMAYYYLGLVLHAARQFPAAAECHRRALKIEPNLVQAYSPLGVALQMLGNFAEAKTCYEQALAAEPKNITTQFNLASIAHVQGNFDEAENGYRAVLEQSPDHCEALSGLGALQLKRGDLAGAAEHLDRAIARWPEVSMPRKFHAMLLLTRGELGPGFREYEHRLPFGQSVGRFGQPRWDGRRIVGQTLLAYAESANDDTLQFMRYDPLVRQRAGGGRVMVAVPQDLIPLLQTSGFRELMPAGSSLPRFDLEVSLESLPALFKTTLDTIPADVPYLHADSKLMRLWQTRLGQVAGLKVGIQWQTESIYPTDRDKSVPLECFAPLARTPGVTLISLQQGVAAEQANQLVDFHVISYPAPEEPRGAYMDAAAMIRNLDLVITCDSALAHLAGGLAARVWVALPAAADWRWMLARGQPLVPDDAIISAARGG